MKFKIQIRVKNTELLQNVMQNNTTSFSVEIQILQSIIRHILGYGIQFFIFQLIMHYCDGKPMPLKERNYIMQSLINFNFKKIINAHYFL